MRQVISTQSNNVLHTSNTEYNYLHRCRPVTWNAQAINREQMMAVAGIVTRFHVDLTAAPDTGNSYTFTLLINGSDTDVEIVISDLETEGTNYDDFATLAAGDLATIRCVPSSSPDTPSASWTFMFEGATFGDTAIIGGRSNALSASANEINHPSGGFTWTTESGAGTFDRQSLFPADGTLRDMYIEMDESPGGSGRYRFRTEPSDIAINIDEPALSGNNTSSTKDVSAGDDIRIICIPSSSPTNNPTAFWGFNFQPDDQTEAIVIAGSFDGLNSSTTEYNVIASTGALWTAELMSPFPLCRITGFYVEVSNPPAPTPPDEASWKFTIRKNAIATGVVIVINNTAVRGSNTNNRIELDDWDNLSIECVPDNNPASADAIWGITVEAVYPFMDATMMMGMGV